MRSLFFVPSGRYTEVQRLSASEMLTFTRPSQPFTVFAIRFLIPDARLELIPREVLGFYREYRCVRQLELDGFVTAP